MAARRITDLGLVDWRQLAQELGARAFRGDQVFHWVAGRGVFDPAAMSDVPKDLRAAIADRFDVTTPSASWQRDEASTTEKLLMPLRDGDAVEAVLIIEGARTTTCLSTQVGCPVGCRFCASGMLGLRRNLTRGEIVDQFLLLRARAQVLGRRVSNVVMMGMGEPLLNYEATLGALDSLNHRLGAGIGARHLTVSTIGLRKGIDRLMAEGRQYTLAFSLHAPDDAIREQIVPFRGAMKVAELADAARAYLEGTGREVTFEYVLLAGVNAGLEHARALSRLLRGIRGTVNLIPYNENPGLAFRCPSPESVEAFAGVLRRARIKVTVRKRKGSRILAACGQLRLQEAAKAPPSEP